MELLRRKIFLNNIYTSGIPHASATHCHLSFITLSKTYPYDLFCKCALVIIPLSGNFNFSQAPGRRLGKERDCSQSGPKSLGS